MDSHDITEFNAQWPTHGRVSSNFGRRYLRKHEGIDIAAPKGNNIYPTAPGVVSFVGWQNGYGKVVIIKHYNGLESLYAHCSKIVAKKGSRVHRGSIIAKVGQTGNATGPHVHFEIRDKNSDPINPRVFLDSHKKFARK